MINKRQQKIPNGVIKALLMNHLTGRNKTSKECYLEMYLNALNEANKLLKEAELLFRNTSYERAYFLGFQALEEISKSQLAADVYTGLITENEFNKDYRDHKRKISRVKWIQIDGNTYPFFRGDGIKISDFDFRKKLRAMYVDLDLKNETVSTPGQSITKDDAASIIKAGFVGLYRIYQVTEENGEQIGTKGFMK